MLGCRILRPAQPRVANAVGAAFAALAALGYLRPEQMEQRIAIERAFTPNRSQRGIYEELFREFLHVYEQLRPLCRRLNRGRNRRP